MPSRRKEKSSILMRLSFSKWFFETFLTPATVCQGQHIPSVLLVIEEFNTYKANRKSDDTLGVAPYNFQIMARDAVSMSDKTSLYNTIRPGFPLKGETTYDEKTKKERRAGRSAGGCTSRCINQSDTRACDGMARCPAGVLRFSEVPCFCFKST